MGNEKWTDTTLGDCADFLSGGTPLKSEPSYWNGDIPWVSAKDMKMFRLHDAEDHISVVGAENGSRIVPAETILILVRGMTLHNDLPICVIKRPMAFNQDVRGLRAKEGVDQEWLAYALLGRKREILRLVDSASHGTGRINSPVMRALPITLPPPPIQRQIARVLGALDDKIELNGEMAKTLEAAARALFESWFVRFEHPGGKGPAPRLVDSPMGPIPEGWTVRPLDTIARFLNGLALQKFPPKDGEPTLPVIKIAQLRKGDTVGADQANTEIAADYVVSDGDMLFSWSGSLECVLWTGGLGALNQHLFKVTSTEFPQWFVYLWVLQHLPEFRHIAAAKATTMGHIQRHHLTNALAAVPPAKVLAEMGRTLGPMIEAIPHRMIEARTLAAMRDSLLPRLISGELEIPAAMLKEAAR